VGGGVDFTPSITPAEKLDAVKRAGGDGIAGY
jgi:hypothetical protein